jgi:prepilin-type N-terminal cleavage/methylation domain-containing protein
VTRRQHGWTLVELIASLALISAAAGAAGALAIGAERARDLGGACAQDVVESRRALTGIERDLRGAGAVRIDDGVLAVAGALPAVWSVHGRSLVRTAGGATQTFARNVAALRTRRDGDVVSVTLEFGRRDANAPRAAVVSTQVRLRCAEGVR